jgi:hypothetical protein
MNVKMKAIGFLWLLFCATGTLFAQQAVVTAGGNISSASGSVSYSIGQVMYSHIEGEVGSLNQGVQQPHVFTIVGVEDVRKDIIVRLFPNPANQFVHLQLTTPAAFDGSKPLSARMYDMQGNLLSTQNLSDDITTISLNQLTEAMYILQVWQDQTQIKSFKLFKSN